MPVAPSYRPIDHLLLLPGTRDTFLAVDLTCLPACLPPPTHPPTHPPVCLDLPTRSS
jgi:hypothetical protein